MSHSLNIDRIKTVSHALGALKEKIVFVGGAVISLYADRAVFEVRATEDVDVIIEIVNYSARAALEEKLRQIGFAHDIESSVVCRFKIAGVVVDVMPTNDPSIGFTNRWYPEGFKQSVMFTIDQKNTIKILSAPYFLATKLEAFKSRGKGNGRTSHDFEDIVFVLENRSSVWEEMNSLNGEIKAYLKHEFLLLLNNSNIPEWIDCHVERGTPPATLLILQQLKKCFL